MVSESDRTKTAFITKYGLFQFRRLAMGLCNAPATFQRAMSQVLTGLNWKTAIIYLGDLIIVVVVVVVVDPLLPDYWGESASVVLWGFAASFSRQSFSRAATPEGN